MRHNPNASRLPKNYHGKSDRMEYFGGGTDIDVGNSETNETAKKRHTYTHRRCFDFGKIGYHMTESA